MEVFLIVIEKEARYVILNDGLPWGKTHKGGI